MAGYAMKLGDDITGIIPIFGEITKIAITASEVAILVRYKREFNRGVI